MSTIDERLQWIIDNLRQPDGLPWNQKALARAMGLKSPAHVGQVVRGDVEDPRGSFLEALVRATGVNGHWLLTGDGEGVEGIVRGQALTLIITPELPAGLEGLLSPSGVLYVRRSCDRSHELVVALHELAHHALAEHEHTHADVWRVALAMGAPRSLVRRCRGDAVELAATTGLPVWACELRINAVKHGLG